MKMGSIKTSIIEPAINPVTPIGVKKPREINRRPMHPTKAANPIYVRAIVFETLGLLTILTILMVNLLFKKC